MGREGHTKIHDVVSADSTVVDDDVPSPKSHRVPLYSVSDMDATESRVEVAKIYLLDFKSLLAISSSVCTFRRLSPRGFRFRWC